MLGSVANKKGGLHIGALIFLLAAIGAWFLYDSYRRGNIESDMSRMLNDVRNAAELVVTDPTDLRVVDENLAEVQEIIEKYKRQ